MGPLKPPPVVRPAQPWAPAGEKGSPNVCTPWGQQGTCTDGVWSCVRALDGLGWRVKGFPGSPMCHWRLHVVWCARGEDRLRAQLLLGTRAIFRGCLLGWAPLCAPHHGMLSPFLAHLWLGAPLPWLCLGCGQVTLLPGLHCWGCLPPGSLPCPLVCTHWGLNPPSWAEGCPVKCPAHPACAGQSPGASPGAASAQCPAGAGAARAGNSLE